MKGIVNDIFFPDYHDVEPEFVGGGHGVPSAELLQRTNHLSEVGEPYLGLVQYRVLSRLIREDDPATKERMIAHNLQQVINIARRYINRGLGLPELVRQGNEGLIQALRRYEPVSYSCFSDFATLCVCQHINLAILNQKRPRRHFHFTPPVHFQPMK
ncbi:MAG: sigma factor [Sideroxyarcus sp.]